MVSESANRTMRHTGAALLCGLFALGVVSGCSDGEPPGTGMEIRVQPLEFDSVLRVCYDIQVYDNIGTLLWQAGDPNVNWDQGDTATICSDEYGTGSGGDIQYIGSCDPTFNPNVVALTIDGIYTINGRLEDGVDWLPTCTVSDPCFQYVTCEPDSNVLVAFNILVMRSANQGFFDIAVKFDDIFCSAKVDCAYDPEGLDPITFLDQDGSELQSAVVGLACTAGPDTDGEDVMSVLHVNDVRIVCGDQAGPLAEALVWTCEQDNPSYYGYALNVPSSGPELLGMEVTRDPGTLEYIQNPLVVNGLPPEYSTAVIWRVFADAAPERDAVAVFVTPPADPIADGPIARLHVGTVRKSSPPWNVSEVADPLGEDILMPRALDTNNLLAVNTVEASVPAGGRVIIYDIVGAPGARILDKGRVIGMPDGLSACDRFQLLDGYFIADCRRRRDVDGVTYEGVEGVLWLQNINVVGDRTVLVPTTPEKHFRVSDIIHAGIRVEPKDLVVALDARFQWSKPTAFNLPFADDTDADSQSFAVIYRCRDKILGNCKADDPAPLTEKYIGHETVTKPRLETNARAIIDQFILGRFGFEFEVLETRAAVIELRDGLTSNAWFDWIDSGGKSIPDVTLIGMFPESRIVYGMFGKPQISPLDGSGPRQHQAFFAKIPGLPGAPVTITSLPIPTGSEVRELIGRAGPDGQARIIAHMARLGPGGVVIHEVGEYRFKPDFGAVERLTYMGPLSFHDGVPINDTPNEFEFARTFYARDRALETRAYDAVVANCSQYFGAVRVPGRLEALIVDPDLDVDPSQPPPGDPEIGDVTLAVAEPLGLPAWVEGALTYAIIDPSGPEGNAWHGGDIVMGVPPSIRPDDTAPVLINYAIYRGVEELDCGSGSCNKLYWNVAVGFDDTVPNCTLYFDATVSAASTLEGGFLPTGTWWPWLEATVPLTDASGALTCRQYPMGSPEYPAVAHPVEDDRQACHRYDGSSLERAPACKLPEYWTRYREWAP